MFVVVGAWLWAHDLEFQAFGLLIVSLVVKEL